MKQKKININYDPLQISGGIEVVGSVPPSQSYESTTNQYTPDYTLVNCILFPRCNATDPSSMSQQGSVNAQLTNMTWQEIIDGTSYSIESTNTNYEITQSGNEKGKIVIKKNSSVSHPITLAFKANYLDTRTNQVFTFRYSKILAVKDASPAIPILTIDAAETTIWNPLHDADNQTIKATLSLVEEDITSSAKCNIFVYRLLSNGNLESVSGDDLEIVSKTKDTIVVNRNLIGDEQTYVFKYSYSASGTPSTTTPNDGGMICSTTIVRRIGKIEADWKGVSNMGTAASTKFIYPIPIIWDGTGALNTTISKDILRPVWYVKKATESTYTKVAEGYAPKIEVSDGMSLGIEIYDNGAYALVTNNNKQVTNNSKYVINRKYKPLNIF